MEQHSKRRDVGRRRTRRPRFVLIYVAYVVLCTAVSLVAAEYVLRAMHPRWRTTPRYQHDPLTMLVPSPNVRARVWSTNGLGAWGGDLQPGVDSVLVFGDSNIEMRRAAESDSFPAQLAEGLGSVQVANFGVRGYGPDQSVLRLLSLLEEEHELGRVRAVVLHLFADNDLGDLIRNNLPQFNDRVPSSAKRVLPEFTRIGLVGLHYVGPRVVWEALLTTSLAPLVLPENYYQPPKMPNIPRQVEEYDEYKQGHYTHVFADHYDSAINRSTSPELDAQARETLGRVLRLFLQLSRTHAFCPIVTVQPAKIDATNQDSRTPKRDQRRLSALMEGVSADIGLPTLSLYDSFYDKPYYYPEPGDNHWNPAGMKEAARLTAQRLTQECAIPR